MCLIISQFIPESFALKIGYVFMISILLVGLVGAGVTGEVGAVGGQAPVEHRGQQAGTGQVELAAWLCDCTWTSW